MIGLPTELKQITHVNKGKNVLGSASAGGVGSSNNRFTYSPIYILCQPHFSSLGVYTKIIIYGEGQNGTMLLRCMHAAIIIQSCVSALI